MILTSSERKVYRLLRKLGTPRKNARAGIKETRRIISEREAATRITLEPSLRRIARQSVPTRNDTR